MISQETKTIIETTAKEFLDKLGAGARIHNVSADDSTVSVEVTMEDAQVFIGDRGRTLLEIQHLLQAMARKKIDERFYISLDINDYKKRKEEYLRDLAKTTADEVVLLKQAKELPPMPAAERRIIHLALQEREDIVTDSMGDGDSRRVVVKLGVK
ncbi:MAG TPA: hypothetical protein ENI13_00375 [candidate division CPR3 bacterium]|uniref:R3H domain-containing protein n=1 Tax=candidate division CPR3 bacterium TaxID=2268181 RepID=A0A7C1SQY8_UNCC3|nr:hypothetical protein [Patescibacteria group bacterium]HEB13418.1 hypothetical protein [candidate division CPR3 bacterium]